MPKKKCFSDYTFQSFSVTDFNRCYMSNVHLNSSKKSSPTLLKESQSQICIYRNQRNEILNICMYNTSILCLIFRSSKSLTKLSLKNHNYKHTFPNIFDKSIIVNTERRKSSRKKGTLFKNYLRLTSNSIQSFSKSNSNIHTSITNHLSHATIELHPIELSSPKEHNPW